MRICAVVIVVMVLLLAGCASPQVPAVMDQAERAITAPEASQIADERPRLIREAREHLEEARQAMARRDVDRAELHASIALARYQSARDMSLRDRAQALTRRTESNRVRLQRDVSFARRYQQTWDRIPGMLDIEEMAPGKGDPPSMEDDTVDDDTVDEGAEGRPQPVGSPRSVEAQKEAAEDAIVDAVLLRAEALGNFFDDQCQGPFREFEATLELANERFENGDYVRAEAIALRAVERLRRCEQEGQSLTIITPTEPAVTDADASALEEAIDALQEAQLEYTRLIAVYPADAFVQIERLLETSERWLLRDRFVESRSFSARAMEQMEALQAELDVQAEEALEASDDVTGDAPDRDRQRISPGDDEAAQESAPVEESTRSEEVRPEQRQSSVAPASEAMEARIGQLENERDEALARARRAEEERDAAQARIEGDAQGRDASSSEAIQPTPSDAESPGRTEAVEAIARARNLRARHDDQRRSPVFQTADSLLSQANAALEAGRHGEARTLATQAGYAFDSLADAQTGPDEEQWRPAYQIVMEALIERDRVSEEIGEPEESIFERGVERLERSRLAWERDDFVGAQTLAESARDDFQSAMEAAQQRESEEEQRARQAEQARQAEEEQRAREAAEQARQAEEEQRAREAEQARQTADVLRRADAAMQRCESERCQERDSARWSELERRYAEAERRADEQEFDEAQHVAREVIEATDELRDIPLPFRVPEGVTRVTKQGDQLVLSPRILFHTASAEVTSESVTSIEELAQTILANRESVLSVHVVGHTDSRGGAQRNMEISQERAQSVRTRLIRLGVPDELVEARGRGLTEPIADNSTADGRELNRRVEVQVELK